MSSQVGAPISPAAKITFLFLVLWFSCHILYPLWLLPLSPGGRLLVYLGLLLYFSFNAWLLFHWIKEKVEWTPSLPTWPLVVRKIKEHSLLALIILLCAGLHIYSMMLPLTTGGDEDAHSTPSLMILKNIGIYSERFFHLSPYAFVRLVTILAIIALVIFIFLGKRLEQKIAHHGRKLLILTIFLLSVFLAVYFYLLRNHPFHMTLIGFPPLERVALIVPYSLFGVHEYVARLPSLIFSLLTAVFMFKLVRLYRDRWTATLAGVLFIFIPVYFYLGSLAYPEAGGMLCILVASFYFLRHARTLSYDDLLFSVFFLSLGVLYKRVVLVMWGVFGVYWLVSRMRRERWLNWSTYPKFVWIGLVPIIPYLITVGLFSEVRYVFDLSNWTALKTATQNLSILPGQVTLPLFFLFAGGLIWALLKKRDNLTLYSLILFATYYVFWTSYFWIGESRFMMSVFPSVVIVAASFLGELRNSVRWKKAISILAVFLVGFMIYKIPVNPVSRSFEYGSVFYFSYDEIYNYLKDNLESREKVGFTSPITTAAGFYRYKFGLEHKLDFVYLSEDALSNSEATRRYFEKENIRYLLIFYPQNYPFFSLDAYKRLENFVDSSENIFTEVRKSVQKHGVLWLGELK